MRYGLRVPLLKKSMTVSIMISRQEELMYDA